MRVRITKNIPTRRLEGFDVGHYKQGKVYEIGRSLFEILFLYGYAELEEGIAVTLPPPRDQAEEPRNKRR